MAKRRRPFVVALNLDEKEKTELQTAAEAAGLALSVFIRALVLTSVRRNGGGVRIEPMTERA